MNLNKYNRLSGDTGVDEDESQKDLKIISYMTRKEIEKSFKIDKATGTEAYYSDRYGWTLRKIID